MVKKKNKRLLARICSLIGVLVVLCSMALPAFASGTGSVDSSLVYPLFQFDYWQICHSSTDASYLLPWLFNSFYDNDVIFNDEFESRAWFSASGGYMPSNNFFTASIELGWEPSAYDITLFSSDCYFSTLGSGLCTLSLYPSEASARCVVSFDYCYLTVVDNQYVERSVPFSVSLSGSSFDISHAVISLIVDLPSFDPQNIHISNLSVVLSNISTCESINYSVWCSKSLRTSSDYFRSSNLTYSVSRPSSGDFSFDWLMSAVSGFLEVELWPGFSLGGILGVVFMIGLLFVFLKFAV